MKILGVGPSMFHDPAAALIIDGEVVAAAEEERFIREKHACNKLPIQAIKYCLDFAKITAEDIDVIAFPWSAQLYHQLKFNYFWRKILHSPDRAIKAIIKAKRICQAKALIVQNILQELKLDPIKTKIMFVEHHLAHAASAYYCSGFKEASILSIDGSGEFTCTLLARADNKGINKLIQINVPDSLGLFYSTFTEYLGFRSNNGEYKLMGMAPYGNSEKINIDHILFWDDKKSTYRCNDNYVWVKRNLRQVKDKMYSKLLVKEFGPPRQGDGLAEPYINIAASVQKKLEEIVITLVDQHLKSDLLNHGNLCFAGGCALNVALNRKLLEIPYIKNLWVQPASHDAGASLGAAVYAAAECNQQIKPMSHAYLGPEFEDQVIEQELVKFDFLFKKEVDICKTTADLLNSGNIVGWFQGRMEWGPRALGNRSILGNPTIKGTADKINSIIKLRENWRPFCPSILKEHAKSILNSDHPAPFMTIAFKVNNEWRKKIPEVVHVDNTCRPQIVDKETNPRFHKVIENFYKKSKVPVLINTSLNRRGEPMVCSPFDALKMFKESGLDYLAIGDYLVRK
ncbi:MAG: carbamoyltransferase C-terminal domain-containing protein [Candidatus Omnitrophota bacterium]